MRELVIQFISVLSSRVLQRALNLGSIILIARALSVSDYGVYGIFVTTVTLAISIGSLGLRQAVAYFMGQDPEQEKQIVNTAISLIMPLTIVAAISATLWLQVSRPEIDQRLFPPIITALTGHMLILIAQGKNLGRGWIMAFNVYEAMPFALLLVCVVCATYFFNLSIESAIWLYASSYLLTGVAAYIRSLFESHCSAFPDKELAIKLVKQGLPYALALFLATANNFAGLYLLNAMGLKEETGHFYMAWQINNALLNVTTALGIVFFSHGVRSKDPQETLRQVGRLTSLLVWAMLFAAIAGIIFFPYVIPLLLGEAYKQAIPLMIVLFCMMPIVSMSRVLYPTLGGLGLPYISMVLLIPALFLNILASWFFIAQWGVIGTVYGLAVSQFVLAAGYFIIIRVKFGLSPAVFLIPAPADIKNAALKIKKRILAHKGKDA